MTRHFTKDEVHDLFFKGEITRGDPRRWTSTDISVVEVDGKYYELYAEIGLTESQENEYEDQEAPEVELVERTVVVQEWEIKE